jgi:hypothetical protein
MDADGDSRGCVVIVSSSATSSIGSVRSDPRSVCLTCGQQGSNDASGVKTCLAYLKARDQDTEISKDKFVREAWPLSPTIRPSNKLRQRVVARGKQIDTQAHSAASTPLFKQFECVDYMVQRAAAASHSNAYGSIRREPQRLLKKLSHPTTLCMRSCPDNRERGPRHINFGITKFPHKIEPQRGRHRHKAHRFFPLVLRSLRRRIQSQPANTGPPPG